MKNLLIICLDNLGDTVMATPVAAALKTLYPTAQIGFWVKDYAAGLLKNAPHVDRVHASDPFWDSSPGRSKGGFLRFLKTIKEIRGFSYDAAIILNTEWRRSLAALLAGIPVRVGYARRSSSVFLTHSFPTTPGHIVDDHLRLVAAWSGRNFPSNQYFPRLHVDNNAPKKSIAMHPFSGDPERKNWPVSRWADLLQNLSRSLPGYSFTIVGSHNDEPQMSQLKINDRVTLRVEQTLPDVLHLLAEAELFVGGDSGPGHMAAALGTPVVSLFGSFNPDRCRPLGKNKTAVLQKNPLKDLPVETVADKILEMLR